MEEILLSGHVSSLIYVILFVSILSEFFSNQLGYTKRKPDALEEGFCGFCINLDEFCWLGFGKHKLFPIWRSSALQCQGSGVAVLIYNIQGKI